MREEENNAFLPLPNAAVYPSLNHCLYSGKHSLIDYLMSTYYVPSF